MNKTKIEFVSRHFSVDVILCADDRVSLAVARRA